MLALTSQTYEQNSGCYTQLVKSLLADHQHEVAFISTNYDDLLECKLSELDPAFTFNSLDDFVVDGRGAKVFKLHGSVTWAFRIGRKGGTWQAAVDDLNLEKPIGDIQVLPRRSQSNAILSDSWYYPVLTAPLASKTPGDSVCPESHIEAANDFLADCKKYLIIGTSGRDRDLLKVLSDSSSTPGVIHYVSGDDVEEVRHNFENEVPQFATTMWAPFRTRAGLRDYLSTDQFQEFLEA